IPAGMSDIHAAVVADDEIIAAEAIGDHRRLARWIIRDNLIRSAGDGEKPAVGAEGLAVAALIGGEELSHLAVEADLVSLAGRHVVEEALALGIDCGAFRGAVALGHQLPVLAGQEDFLELRRATAGLHWSGPVLPQPAHGVGKELGSVLGVVTLRSP